MNQLSPPSRAASSNAIQVSSEPAPPALVVGHARERVEDAVQVRRDVHAQYLDVVADVSDHGHARGIDGADEAPQEPGAPDAARECDDPSHGADPTGENGDQPMDTSRFSAELSGLFDDYPRSAHPRDRRLADLVEGIPNLATENTLAVIELAASLLGPGESYVEAGAYMGASLIAASHGGARDPVAIDHFAFGPMTVAGRDLPAAGRAQLEANLERFGVRATILEGDTLEVVRGGGLAGRTVGVFYYDACHEYEPQLEALRLVEPYLAGEALLIVDDSDWDDVRRAIDDYLAGQPRATLVADVAGAAGDQDWWWDGMAALAWMA